MIPGEEPPYRLLLSEQIDIEQGLQELGQVSAGLVTVEDALEEWGEYHREPKLKGVLCYLDQCIVDWDEAELKNPSAYSWEGENYSKEDTVRIELVGLGRLENAFARLVSLLREGTKGNRTHVSESKVLRDLNTREGPLARLVRIPREGTTVNRRRVSCGVQPLVWITRCMSYQQLSLSMLRQLVSRVMRQYRIPVCTGQDQVVMVVTISDRRIPLVYREGAIRLTSRGWCKWD